MLTFDRVSFSYKKEQPVLTDLSFRLPAGGRLTVMGSSGCGKSTLLSLAAGLLDPTAGPGHPGRPPHNIRIPGAAPLSVADRCGKSGGGAPKPRPESDCGGPLRRGACGGGIALPRRAFRRYEEPGLAGAGTAPGGDLFLLDEPFAALDPALRRRMTDLLSARLTGTGAAALLVTHQKEDARRFGGSLLTL